MNLKSEPIKKKKVEAAPAAPKGKKKSKAPKEAQTGQQPLPDLAQLVRQLLPGALQGLVLPPDQRVQLLHPLDERLGLVLGLPPGVQLQGPDCHAEQNQGDGHGAPRPWGLS